VRYHSLVIEASSLPEDLVSIAWTASPKMLSFHESDQLDNTTFWGSLNNVSITNPSERTDIGASELDGYKVVMGIRHSSRPHYGVQFHPESVATHYGRQIFQNFKRITTEFGSQSSLLQERKVHSIGKLGISQVLYMTKYFLHISFMLHHS
jgi:para-aminobenzoate synthetase